MKGRILTDMFQHHRYLSQSEENICIWTHSKDATTYYVFTYIYSLLIEKDIGNCWNILIKLLCVYVCLSSNDVSIFWVWVFSFFSYFVLSILWYFIFHVVTNSIVLLLNIFKWTAFTLSVREMINICCKNSFPFSQNKFYGKAIIENKVKYAILKHKVKVK